MVPYALPRSSSKMAKILIAAILVCFVEFKQTIGLAAIENNTSETPSCCQVTFGENGPGTITVTAPAINKTIVESSQLVGACLINASASTNNYIICTRFKAATSSAADCVSGHDPPNPWCQDNVISMNFTQLLNGSGLLFATIQVSSCDMKLGLSLRGRGIHSFKAGVVCQYDCTSVASGQENLSTQSTPTIALSSPANGSTGTVASGQENLSTQSTPTIALSSSANGSTGTVASGQENLSTSANGSTDEIKPSIAVGKIIGICIGCAVLLALLLLVCRYMQVHPKQKRARSRTNSSQGTSSIDLIDTAPNNN